MRPKVLKKIKNCIEKSCTFAPLFSANQTFIKSEKFEKANGKR